MTARPHWPWAATDATISEALTRGGYPSPQGNPYTVELPRKDGSVVRFEARQITSVQGDVTRPGWESLILWQRIDGAFVAARGWTRLPGARSPTVWKVCEVAIVHDAMDVWGWTALAHQFAHKLKVQTPQEQPPAIG